MPIAALMVSVPDGGGGSPIAYNVLSTSTVDVTGGEADTASVAPGANKLILAVAAARWDDVPTGDVLSAAGNGLTWTLVEQVFVWDGGASTRTVSVFKAIGSSPSSGAMTFTETGVGANITGRLSYTIVEFENADDAGTAATNRSQTGEAEPPLTVTIPGTPESGDVFVGVVGGQDGNRLADPAIAGGWERIVDYDSGGDSGEMSIGVDWDPTAADATPTWENGSFGIGAMGFIVKKA